MRCRRTGPAGVPLGQTIVGCVPSCHCVVERRSCVGAVVSSDVSLRDVTCGRSVEKDMITRRDCAG